MMPLFHIPIKRTRDGGETFYIEKYWAFPLSKELRIHSGTFAKYNLMAGLNFRYKGDEVIWLWPWERKQGKWISVCSEGCFSSLREIDKFWEDYWKEMSKN